MFQKVTLLEILKSSMVFAGLQYIVCNAARNQHLTKFLKSVLKLTENFQEVVSNMVLYQKYTDIHNVHGGVPFFLRSLHRIIALNSSKHSPESLQVYLKRTSSQMFYLTRNFERQKLRFPKAKKITMSMPMPTLMPMLMLRCRCRDFQMAETSKIKKVRVELYIFFFFKLNL